MNSTTSDQQLDNDITIGDELYVPFWIILQFLDAAPPDPFIRGTVVDKKWNTGVSQDGPVEVLCCDLKCPKSVFASDIPASYLIKPDCLPEWAERIGNWFRDFPSTIT